MKFSRQHRLLKPSEFQSVFRRPLRSEDRYFKVLARINELGNHRLGLAISKKACRRAVDRNRIRRLVRESFRNHLAGMTDGEALDIVVIGKGETPGGNNTDLYHSLESHWHTLMTMAGQRQARTRT